MPCGVQEAYSHVMYSHAWGLFPSTTTSSPWLTRGRGAVRRAAARRPPRPGSLAAAGMREPDDSELSNMLQWPSQPNPRARPLLGRGAPAVRGAAADRSSAADHRVPAAADLNEREGEPLVIGEGSRDQRTRRPLRRGGGPGPNPSPDPRDALEVRKRARLERLEAAARGLQGIAEGRGRPPALSRAANPGSCDDRSRPVLLTRPSVSELRELGVVSRALQATGGREAQGESPRRSAFRNAPAEASDSAALRGGTGEPAQCSHERTVGTSRGAAGLRHRAAGQAAGKHGGACGFRSE